VDCSANYCDYSDYEAPPRATNDMKMLFFSTDQYLAIQERIKELLIISKSFFRSNC